MVPVKQTQRGGTFFILDARRVSPPPAPKVLGSDSKTHLQSRFCAIFTKGGRCYHVWCTARVPKLGANVEGGVRSDHVVYLRRVASAWGGQKSAWGGHGVGIGSAWGGHGVSTGSARGQHIIRSYHAPCLRPVSSHNSKAGVPRCPAACMVDWGTSCPRSRHCQARSFQRWI